MACMLFRRQVFQLLSLNHLEVVHHCTDSVTIHFSTLNSLSVIALRDAPQVARMLANSDMRLTVTSTVLQAISGKEILD